MSEPFYTFGEFPQFSKEEKAEIRRLLHREWQADHTRKNETANRHVRDAITERLRWREGLMQKVGEL